MVCFPGKLIDSMLIFTICFLNISGTRSICRWNFVQLLIAIFILAAFEKRSDLTQHQQQQQPDSINSGDDEHMAMQHQLNAASGNDRLGDLLDLNSEPAVEDLMRQIMSQAKLWEAIQEANREMVAQKSHNSPKSRERFPLTFSAQ